MIVRRGFQPKVCNFNLFTECFYRVLYCRRGHIGLARMEVMVNPFYAGILTNHRLKLKLRKHVHMKLSDSWSNKHDTLPYSEKAMKTRLIRTAVENTVDTCGSEAFQSQENVKQRKLSHKVDSLPFFLACPNTLPISIRHAVPPLGSTPPKTHASRWFPIITRRSAKFEKRCRR